MILNVDKIRCEQKFYESEFLKRLEVIVLYFVYHVVYLPVFSIISNAWEIR